MSTPLTGFKELQRQAQARCIAPWRGRGELVALLDEREPSVDHENMKATAIKDACAWFQISRLRSGRELAELLKDS